MNREVVQETVVVGERCDEEKRMLWERMKVH